MFNKRIVTKGRKKYYIRQRITERGDKPVPKFSLQHGLQAKRNLYAVKRRFIMIPIIAMNE